MSGVVRSGFLDDEGDKYFAPSSLGLSVPGQTPDACTPASSPFRAVLIEASTIVSVHSQLFLPAWVAGLNKLLDDWSAAPPMKHSFAAQHHSRHLAAPSSTFPQTLSPASVAPPFLDFDTPDSDLTGLHDANHFSSVDVATALKKYNGGYKEAIFSLFAAKGLDLPPGTADDLPSDPTMVGVLQLVQNNVAEVIDKVIEQHEMGSAGVPPGFVLQPDAVAFIEKMRTVGIRVAIITHTRHMAEMLENLSVHADVVVEFSPTSSNSCGRRPSPVLLLQAIASLGLTPSDACVIEDSSDGYCTAHLANFGLAVALLRGSVCATPASDSVRTAKRAVLWCPDGADVVISDLTEANISITAMTAWFSADRMADAWVLRYRSPSAREERTREALLGIGNGAIAVRSSLPLSWPDRECKPKTPRVSGPHAGTFITGHVASLRVPPPETFVSLAGEVVTDEEPQAMIVGVNLPSPLPIRVIVNGIPVVTGGSAWCGTPWRLMSCEHGLSYSTGQTFRKLVLALPTSTEGPLVHCGDLSRQPKSFEAALEQLQAASVWGVEITFSIFASMDTQNLVAMQAFVKLLDEPELGLRRSPSNLTPWSHMDLAKEGPCEFPIVIVLGTDGTTRGTDLSHAVDPCVSISMVERGPIVRDSGHCAGVYSNVRSPLSADEACQCAGVSEAKNCCSLCYMAVRNTVTWFSDVAESAESAIGIREANVSFVGALDLANNSGQCVVQLGHPVVPDSSQPCPHKTAYGSLCEIDCSACNPSLVAKDPLRSTQSVYQVYCCTAAVGDVIACEKLASLAAEIVHTHPSHGSDYHGESTTVASTILSPAESKSSGLRATFAGRSKVSPLFNRVIDSIAHAPSYSALLIPHRNIWQQLWDVSDIQVQGDRFVDRFLRLSMYHLLSSHYGPTSTPLDPSIIPPRGLIRGQSSQVFTWDEMIVCRAVATVMPSWVRTIIQYRYLRLGKARSAAAAIGCRGALFPFYSARSGANVAPKWKFNRERARWEISTANMQYHVNLAVFLLVSDFLVISSDEDFFLDYGFEILLSIALFFVSFAKIDKSGRYHLTGVVGFDGYHHGHGDGVADNTYTNVMVAWTLDRTLALLKEKEFQSEKVALAVEKASVSIDDLHAMEVISTKLYVAIHENGTLEQFGGMSTTRQTKQGVFSQTRISAAGRSTVAPAGGFCHHADTLMLWNILGEHQVYSTLRRLGYLKSLALKQETPNSSFMGFQLNDAQGPLVVDAVGNEGQSPLCKDDCTAPPVDSATVLRRTVEYFIDNTIHSDGFSCIATATAAAAAGLCDEALSLFYRGVQLDLNNETTDGLSLGCMAGMVMYVMTRIVGLGIKNGKLSVSPSLPSHWSRVSLRRSFAGDCYHVIIEKSRVTATLEGAAVAEVLPAGVNFHSPTHAKPPSIYLASTLVSPVPWQTVAVDHAAVVSLKQFFSLIDRTAVVRRDIARCLLRSDAPVHVWRLRRDHEVGLLVHILGALTSIRAPLMVDAFIRISCDLSYEVCELQRDILLLSRGEDAVIESISESLQRLGSILQPAVAPNSCSEAPSVILKSLNVTWDEWMKIGLEFFRPYIRSDSTSIISTWYSDRDGTTNNYCGRYRSSVQGVYNSLWICRFAKKCCQHAVFITSAPLSNVGILDVSVNPDGIFIYGASMGREFADESCAVRSRGMSRGEAACMSAFNQAIIELISRPKYEKFSLLGSGVQFKFAQTTIAHQDTARSVPVGESSSWATVVRSTAAGICAVSTGNILPPSQSHNAEWNLVVHDTGTDLEIVPRCQGSKTQASTGDSSWDKGTGLLWLTKRLALCPPGRPALVTGDTTSDLPMISAAQSVSSEGCLVIFVTRDPKLAASVCVVGSSLFL